MNYEALGLYDAWMGALPDQAFHDLIPRVYIVLEGFKGLRLHGSEENRFETGFSGFAS